MEVELTMIIGIGTDIIEIQRVKQACENIRFIDKIYTKTEQELFIDQKHRLASNFAAKEAVSKVFGTGFRTILPREIEVLRDELGKPYVVLYGKALELSRSLGIKQIYLTLSDTKEYAVAFAVGEGELCNI